MSKLFGVMLHLYLHGGGLQERTKPLEIFFFQFYRPNVGRAAQMQHAGVVDRPFWKVKTLAPHLQRGHSVFPVVGAMSATTAQMTGFPLISVDPVRYDSPNDCKSSHSCRDLHGDWEKYMGG